MATPRSLNIDTAPATNGDGADRQRALAFLAASTVWERRLDELRHTAGTTTSARTEVDGPRLRAA